MDNVEVYLETGQEAVRKGVYAALEQNPDVDIIEGLPTGRQQLFSDESESPAITILDIVQYPDNWVDTTLRIREQLPSAAILLLSDSDSDDLRYSALKTGADAFLTRDRIAAKLGKTIEELSYGYLPIIRVLLRPEVASLTLDEFHNFSLGEEEPARPDIRLSFQQRVILQYIENRHAIPQLISNLGISQSRVIEQLESIREKLMEIDEYLRPPLQPVSAPEAEEDIKEIEVPEEEDEAEEASKAIVKAGKPPFKLNLDFLNSVTPLIACPQKLYKGIFRPTVSKLVILFIVMVIGFFLSIHLLPGHNMYVVSSESMEPTISMGDIIVTKTLDEESISHLAPGDIITFEHGKNMVTHRLLSVKGDVLKTKGDAAEESDPWSITASEVKDVYLFRIPLVGYIPQLAKEKLGWFLMIVFPAVVLVGLLVKDIIKEACRKDEPVAENKEVVLSETNNIPSYTG